MIYLDMTVTVAFEYSLLHNAVLNEVNPLSRTNSTNDVMHNAYLNKCTAFTLNFRVLAV